MTTVSIAPALVAAAILVSGCGDRRSVVAPGQAEGPSTSSSIANTVAGLKAVSELPLRGDCTTVITPIDQATAGACSSFEQVPSAFIRITGECRLTHLGLTSIDAVQQLIFQLDANGQPVIVNGQPIITELRNCSTLTAANGDQLRHTSTGTVMTGSTSPEFAFEGTIDITGGTGRFENATGAATFVGTAGLTTGMFSLSGTLSY